MFIKRFFQKGETATVRSWSSMAEEFGCNNKNKIQTPLFFTEGMGKFCGRRVTITEKVGEYYLILEDNKEYSWHPDMFMEGSLYEWLKQNEPEIFKKIYNNKNNKTIKITKERIFAFLGRPPKNAKIFVEDNGNKWVFFRDEYIKFKVPIFQNEIPAKFYLKYRVFKETYRRPDGREYIRINIYPHIHIEEPDPAQDMWTEKTTGNEIPVLWEDRVKEVLPEIMENIANPRGWCESGIYEWIMKKEIYIPRGKKNEEE